MKYKDNYVSEDAKEIKNLVIITLVITAIAVGLYFLTDKVLNKNVSNVNNDVEFDYSICMIGTMLNRPYDEYYVFAYDSNEEKASDYKTLVTNYEAKDDAKKVFIVDLKEKANNVFLADKANLKVTNINDLKIKNNALFLIKDGKINSVYESNYENVLK